MRGVARMAGQVVLAARVLAGRIASGHSAARARCQTSAQLLAGTAQASGMTTRHFGLSGLCDQVVWPGAYSVGDQHRPRRSSARTSNLPSSCTSSSRPTVLYSPAQVLTYQITVDGLFDHPG